MVQLDGSFHRWIKSKEEKQCLMVMIDDATSIREAYLCEEETTKAALILLWKYIEKHGIPKTIYADYKNVYQLDKKTKERVKNKGEAGLTEYGKVCSRLGIEIIGASTPQAKGRVERANGVFQDRLVKELEYEGITTIEGVNRFLEEGYIAELNEKFSVYPESETDFHRKAPSKEEMELIFAIEEERTVSNDWTIRYRGRIYQILSGNRNFPPSRSKVKVLQMMDGGLKFYYREWEIEVEDITYKERPKVKDKKVIKLKKRWKPGIDHPWKSKYIPERRTERI